MDFYPFSSIIHTLPLILITPSDMEIFTIFIFLSSLPFFSSRFETWKGKAVDFPIKRYFSIRKTVLARRSHTSRNSSNKLDFLQFNFMANTFYWLGEFFRLLVIRKFPFFSVSIIHFQSKCVIQWFFQFSLFFHQTFSHKSKFFFIFYFKSNESWTTIKVSSNLHKTTQRIFFLFSFPPHTIIRLLKWVSDVKGMMNV